MKKDDCIFCKLANGDIPVEFIYETDKIVAFKDANPKAPIHVLVVPKNHYDSLNEIDDKTLLADLLDGIRETAKKLGVKSYKTLINTGKEAGQEVFHVHFHLLAGF